MLRRPSTLAYATPHGRPNGVCRVAWLGVLVAAAAARLTVYPRLDRHLSRPRDPSPADRTRFTARSLRAAVDRFAADAGRPPTSAEGLDALYARPPGMRGWPGPYLPGDGRPVDTWGQPFAYQAGGRGGPAAYEVRSAGPDSYTGTEDDVVEPTP